MKRIETVRLYPTAAQKRGLNHALHVTRHLYNAALQERKDAYRLRRVSITHKMQYAELTALRKESHHLKGVYRELEDAVLHRLDLAMQAFFRRRDRGEKAGFLRFRAAARWRQLEFPHGDRALKFDERQQRVRVPGVGNVKLRKGRPVPAHGRAWLVSKRDRWYAQFEVERPAQPLPATGRSVGLDRGVAVLIATSDGELIENPRYVERSRRKLERTQRIMSRRRRGGKNWKKAAAALARLREKIAAQRRDYAHKASRELVDRYDRLALEKLQVRAMTRSAKGNVASPGRHVAAKAGLNRAMLDAGFGLIAKLIAEKAENAGRQIVYVDPRYSSQECSRCGHIASENRSGIRFRCLRCEHGDHADVNAARVILKRAQKGPLASRAALRTATTQEPSYRRVDLGSRYTM